MLHYGRNPSVQVPVDVNLFDGLTPLSGEAPNLSGVVLCLDNGYRLDIDGTFKTNPSSPYIAFSPYSAFTNVYFARLDPSQWKRGHYRCFITHTGGLTYATDFTVGLYIERKLGYSAVYSGTALKMNLWIEEYGDFQADYTDLKNIVLKQLDGTVVHSFADLTSTTGLFSLQENVVLSANQNFVLEANAIVVGPATRPNYSFPLRIGMARP